MKKVPIEQALKRKYPEGVTLVTCCDKKGRANVLPIGWIMQTSFNPPLLAISVGKTRYSHKLISQTKEFVVCFPNEKMVGDVLYCGTRSGRDVDKLKNVSFKTVKAKFVKPPLIEDSVACFECKVRKKIDTGDHTIFIGEILAAYISEKYEKRLYNIGERIFKTL